MRTTYTTSPPILSKRLWYVYVLYDPITLDMRRRRVQFDSLLQKQLVLKALINYDIPNDETTEELVQQIISGDVLGRIEPPTPHGDWKHGSPADVLYWK